MKLFLDCETFSELDLKTVGSYRYTESCEVMIVTWAVDDEPVRCWDCTSEPRPAALTQDIERCDTITAHNSMFDRHALKRAGIDVPVGKWRDTMVQALAHSLPGSLDKLCEVYRLDSDTAKIKDGRRLVMLFCKPRGAKSKIARATRETHPEDWAKFIEYAKQDVAAMREVAKRMPRWNYPGNNNELAHWHLDQKINDRGVLVDVEMGESVIRAIERAKKDLTKETAGMTQGRLESTTQRDATIDFVLEEHGVKLTGMTKAEVSKYLDDEDIPEPVKELLRVRQQASSTSTAKYNALLKRASADHRFRGGIQFCGAARTGRAGGRGFQPQNLPSRGLLPDWLIEEGIQLMRLDAEQLVFPNVMHLASSAVRKVLIASGGKKFCISDLSNIEGRKAAWFAGEDWKLQAFRDFDDGTGHDLYNLAYARAFRVPVESVTKDQRSIGKVQELMLAYAGGVGAFVTGAAGYGFDLEELSEKIFDTLPKNTAAEAYDFLEWCKDTKRPRYGLSDRAFVAVDTLKRLWRRANSKIVAYWKDIQNASELAVITREPQEIRLLRFDMRGSWLRVQLPSGRYLCYPFAEFNSETGLSYYGIDQYTRKWEKIRTYSGKLFENICQASARDILYDAMPGAEKAGFEIVLHVHDELVTEATPDKNISELSAILATNPIWAKGLPLAAAGFEAQRYRK